MNKDYKVYKKHHTRKSSRFNSNQDLFHTLLISSDPVISTIRNIPLVKKEQFPPEVKSLLILEFNNLTLKECEISVQVFKDSDSANEGATAKKIYNEVLNSLKKDGIPLENVIDFASDGCNAMMGPWNSVSSRFKKDFPGIIIQKCICHSFALCASSSSSC